VRFGWIYRRGGNRNGRVIAKDADFSYLKNAPRDNCPVERFLVIKFHDAEALGFVEGKRVGIHGIPG